MKFLHLLSPEQYVSGAVTDQNPPWYRYMILLTLLEIYIENKLSRYVSLPDSENKTLIMKLKSKPF